MWFVQIKTANGCLLSNASFTCHMLMSNANVEFKPKNKEALFLLIRVFIKINPLNPYKSSQLLLCKESHLSLLSKLHSRATVMCTQMDSPPTTPSSQHLR